jgi:PiT family inorganic phosphate transporter
MTALILVCLLLLGAANGANDVSKGVATLAGAGITGYRTAVAWGAITTLAGALASVWFGSGMRRLFSAGIITTAHPTRAFALAVLIGILTWVAAATALRLPVSTTHAIVGALLGAGLLLESGVVHWSALVTKVAAPLLLAAVLAFAVSGLLALAARAVPVRAPAHASAAVTLDDVRDAGWVAADADARPRSVQRGLPGAHWVSAGAVGAARGLNDTPKLAAIGAFGLASAEVSGDVVTYLVAVAMFTGALLVGKRVAWRLGEDVLALTHIEGLRANLVTSTLVAAGAGYGLPMSTTHVSTGAIAGGSGTQLRRLNLNTLQQFILAWTVTPLIAGIVAATAYELLR